MANYKKPLNIASEISDDQRKPFCLAPWKECSPVAFSLFIELLTKSSRARTTHSTAATGHFSTNTSSPAENILYSTLHMDTGKQNDVFVMRFGLQV